MPIQKKSDYSWINDMVLNDYPGIHAIYIYGSRAMGQINDESDWDIALLLPYKLESSKIINLQARLSGLLSAEVDLINIRNINSILQKEIVMKGIRIYDDGTGESTRFEILAISLYQKLCEERRDIIDEGLKSGRFYHV
jgi:uncharacterized protein